MADSARLLAILLLCLLAACGKQADRDRLAEARTSGTIRIAITGTSRPWSYFDDHHQPAGYDVAVARAVMREIGIPHPIFVADSFKSFVEGLRTDKYDLVFNDLTPTPARAEQVDFGRAYGVEDLRIFVNASNRSVAGEQDLKSLRIGVTTGSSNEAWAREHVAGGSIRSYENGALVFRDLALGRIDAALMSHFSGLKYALENDLPVAEVGAPLSFQLSAPAMAKGQPALKAAIGEAVGKLIASGKIDRLADRWVGVDYSMTKAIGIGEREAAAKAGKLVVAHPAGGFLQVVRQSLPLLGPALATTLFLGLSSFVLGGALGMLVALARLSERRPLRWFGFVYVSIFRGTPLLVQLLLIYFGLPQFGIQLGPMTAAILALTLFAASYLSENFRAGILAVDKGQREAATSLGMGYWLTMRRVILPQGLRIALPATGSRLIALMKDTSLASVITVVELTRVADEVGATTFRYIEAFLMIGLVYWLLNQLLTIGQLTLERRLSRHMR